MATIEVKNDYMLGRQNERILYEEIVRLNQEITNKDYEIERLNTIINNIHTYIEKMSYCDIVDNPRKDLTKILERENK